MPGLARSAQLPLERLDPASERFQLALERGRSSPPSPDPARRSDAGRRPLSGAARSSPVSRRRGPGVGRSSDADPTPPSAGRGPPSERGGDRSSSADGRRGSSGWRCGSPGRETLRDSRNNPQREPAGRVFGELAVEPNLQAMRTLRLRRDCMTKGMSMVTSQPSGWSAFRGPIVISPLSASSRAIPGPRRYASKSTVDPASCRALRTSPRRSLRPDGASAAR